MICPPLLDIPVKGGLFYEFQYRGFKVNHKRVQPIMHEAGLTGKQPKAKYHSYEGKIGKIDENGPMSRFSTS